MIQRLLPDHKTFDLPIWQNSCQQTAYISQEPAGTAFALTWT